MSAHSMMLEIPHTVLSKIDGRVKLLLTFSGLVAAVSSKSWQVPFFFGIVSLLILLIAGVSIRMLGRRLLPVFFIASLIGITQIFLWGQIPWFNLNLGFFHLVGYQEGLSQGMLLSSRVFGGMSVMFLLTLTTSVQEWVSALAWFRVPLSIVEIMTLAYSSLFVLLEELQRLQKAQRMRLGYITWWQTVKSTGTVGGILFMRVFDKSQRLWQAMLCRGYDGNIRVSYERSLTYQEGLLAILGFGIILSGWFIGR